MDPSTKIRYDFPHFTIDPSMISTIDGFPQVGYHRWFPPLVNGIHEPSEGNNPAGMGFWSLVLFLSASLSHGTLSHGTNKHGLIWPRIFHNIPYIMTLAQGYTILIYIVLWCFIPILGTGTLSESLETSWRASFSVLGRRQGVNLKLRVASKMPRSALKCLARTKPLYYCVGLWGIRDIGQQPSKYGICGSKIQWLVEMFFPRQVIHFPSGMGHHFLRLQCLGHMAHPKKDSELLPK